MKRLLVLPLIAVALLFSSCGGDSSSSTDAASVKLTPSEISLAVGDVTTVTAEVRDEDGTALTTQPTVVYSSSDPSAMTVSPTGGVCAGVWDASYVVCKPATTPTSAVSLIATVEDTNIKTSVPVYVHLAVDRIDLSASPAVSCVSQGETVQYKATAWHNNVDVTASVGTVSWSMKDTTVGQITDKGLAVSYAPGITYVYATAAGYHSAPLGFVSCPAASIHVEAADGSELVGRQLEKGDSVKLIATVYDTNGKPVNGAPVTFTSSTPNLARVNTTGVVTAEVSALAAGPFTVLASCTPTTCNNATQASVTTPAGVIDTLAMGFNSPVYSNPFTGKISGTSATTLAVTGREYTDGRTNYQLQIYEAGSLSLQSTIVLPHPSNSIVYDRTASKAYIGSPEGLSVLDTSNNTVASATYDVTGYGDDVYIPGRVLAVDSSAKVFVSDEGNSRIFVVDTANSTATMYPLEIADVSFSPDGYRTYAAGPQGTYYFDATGFHALTATPANALAYSPDAQFALSAGTPSLLLGSCRNSVQETELPAATQVGAFMSGASPRFVGVNSTQWIDIVADIQSRSCSYSTQLTPSTQAYSGCDQSKFHLVADGSYAVAIPKQSSSCGAAGTVPFYRSSGKSTGVLSFESGRTPISVSSTMDSRFIYAGTKEGTIEVIDLQDGSTYTSTTLTFIPEAIAVAPK